MWVFSSKGWQLDGHAVVLPLPTKRAVECIDAVDASGPFFLKIGFVIFGEREQDLRVDG